MKRAKKKALFTGYEKEILKTEGEHIKGIKLAKLEVAAIASQGRHALPIGQPTLYSVPMFP